MDDERRATWTTRRRIVVGTLVVQHLCLGAIVAGAVFGGLDTGLADSLSFTLAGTISAVLGSYVFGAVYDDASRRKHAGGGGVGSGVGPG